MKKAVKECMWVMEHASDYQTWSDAARELDRLQGNDQWQLQDESRDYDYVLIKQRLNHLRHLRTTNNIHELVFFLQEGLHGNLGNIATGNLYHRCHFGTKRLISDYVEEVADALDYICDTEFPELNFGDKMRFFKRAGISYGRSGLMLSGGSTLGLFHLGVCKALFENNLLPRVISGSSAGSIITAGLGTYTDDEIPQLLDPEFLYLHAFKVMDWRTMMDKKAIMDSRQLERCLTRNLGDFTFEEAFERTRRIINITVSPTDVHQQPKLLNYMTSPHVLIRRASLASSAVPGLFPAVTLMAKNYEGTIIPYAPGMKWVDGSLKSDLPARRLSRVHNVNHYIVSQTNPHVVPFMSEKQGKRGIGSLAKDLVISSAQAHGNNLLNVARRHVDSNGMGRMLDEMHAITSQNYQGDINILPEYGVKDFMKVISNPTAREIEAFMVSGERATWPQLERIRIASLCSRTFESCIKRLKARQFARGERPHLTVADQQQPPLFRRAVGG